MTKFLKKHDWQPLPAPSVNKYMRILWGYTRSEDNTMMIPNCYALDLLEYCKVLYRNGSSSRRCTDWLYSKTGLTMSHNGFIRRLENDLKAGVNPTVIGEYPDFPIVETIQEKGGVDRNLKRKGVSYKATKNKNKNVTKVRKLSKSVSTKKSWIKRHTDEIINTVKEDPTVLAELSKGQRQELTEVIKEPLPEIVGEIPNNGTSDVEIVFQPNTGPQTQFLSSSEDEVFYGGSRGGGKGASYNTDIVTPFGMRKMGDLKVGDVISNPNGEPQEVIQIHELGERECYKITFSDGRTTLNTLDHLYVVHKTSQTSKKFSYTNEYDYKGEVWTLAEIIKWLDKKEKAPLCSSIKKQNLVIPLCKPIKFTKTYKYQMIKIHPYVLGCLLGDGCLTSFSNFCITTTDSEIVDSFEQFGYKLKKVSKDSISFKIKDLNKRKETYKYLEEYGLSNSFSISKFIPKYYLWAKVEDRFELIKGLMDTDGYVDTRGHISYTTVSKQLAEDVQFLVRSLGAKAKITTKEPLYKDGKGKRIYGLDAYTVNIQHSTPELFFTLTRKKDRAKEYKYNLVSGSSGLMLRIDKVEYNSVQKSRCISVRNPNCLYMQDDFIVTHNTYSLIADPTRYFDHPQFSGLLVRKTMPELRDIIYHSQQLYKAIYPKANFKVQENCWYFPSGARLEFGYAENEQDAERYRGRAYSWIGIDELPQYPTQDVYNMLKSSNRSTAPDLPVQMRSTGNPGGAGSGWVKAKFIDPAPPNTRFYEEFDFIDPITKEKRVLKRTLRFIPATVFDNPYLVQNDSYLSALASLPEVKRKQMLEGNWDVVEGSAFSEFDRSIHVVEPYDLGNYMTKFRAADWGYSSPFCCLWFAVDEDNNIIVYREYYGKETLADDFAQKVADLEKDEHILYGVIDGSTDGNRGERGPTIFETINNKLRSNRRPLFRKADRSAGSRVAGKQEVHKRLALRPTGLLDENGEPIKKPSLVIFNTCVNLIRTLPQLQVDKRDTEKVDTDGEDHAYDALHYGLRSRPISPAKVIDNTMRRMKQKQHIADKTFGY